MKNSKDQYQLFEMLMRMPQKSMKRLLAEQIMGSALYGFYSCMIIGIIVAIGGVFGLLSAGFFNILLIGVGALTIGAVVALIVSVCELQAQVKWLFDDSLRTGATPDPTHSED
jgi:hypothetical protein